MAKVQKAEGTAKDAIYCRLADLTLHFGFNSPASTGGKFLSWDLNPHRKNALLPSA